MLDMAESARSCHLQTLEPNFVSVAGVTVSIAAFQAVDPGSIPGPRKFFFSRTKKERFCRDLNPDYKDQNLGC